MRIPIQRIKRTRLIQTDRFVVAVEVEMVVPADLTKKGKGYAAVDAA